MFARSKDTGVRPTIDTGPGLTKQSMRDESDINLIMAKYRKTGLVSFVNNNQAEYRDVPQIDFQEAMEVIANGNSMFAKMPAHLRKEFNNNPGEFLDFIHDDKNADKAYELGLAERPADYVPSGQEPAVEPETPPQEGE